MPVFIAGEAGSRAEAGDPRPHWGCHLPATCEGGRLGGRAPPTTSVSPVGDRCFSRLCFVFVFVF